MRQPVLVILDIPEDTNLDIMAKDMELTLQDRGYQVKWAIPVQRTDNVPAGAMTA
jgi:hypothetical protein